MAGDDAADDLVELRPAPSVLLRHQADADVVVHAANRVGPRVDLRRGALWVRAGEDGPGVTITHGAANVQVRAGAGVIEVSDMEALLVVASGRAAVKGAAPLPRSVLAGQAVALTLDGTFTDPAPLTPAEMASDRMVVENLARDSLLSAPEGRAVRPAAPAPVVPAPEPEAPASEPEAAVDGEDATIDLPLEAAPLVEVDGAPQVDVEVEPPAPVAPETEEPGSATSAPSALESALAGVGVTDDPAAARVAVDRPVTDDDAIAGAASAGRRRTRILVALVIVALVVFALVALLVLGGSSGS